MRYITKIIDSKTQTDCRSIWKWPSNAVFLSNIHHSSSVGQQHYRLCLGILLQLEGSLDFNQGKVILEAETTGIIWTGWNTKEGVTKIKTISQLGDVLETSPQLAFTCLVLRGVKLQTGQKKEDIYSTNILIDWVMNRCQVCRVHPECQYIILTIISVKCNRTRLVKLRHWWKGSVTAIRNIPEECFWKVEKFG